MNDYIINPWWFYLVNIAEKTNIISIVLCVTFGLACFVFLMFAAEASRDEEAAYYRKAKKSAIACVVMLLLYGVIPSESACKEMMVASLVTKENIANTKEGAREFIDYIFEKVEELQDEDSD